MEALRGQDAEWTTLPLASRSSCATCSHALAWTWSATTASRPPVAPENARRGCSRASIAATILYTPFDLLVEEAGCHRLASSSATYPAYASQALAATEPWVSAHSDLITRYTGAWLRALRWIYDPAARSSVEALLAEETALGLAGVAPGRAYEAFTHPRDGYGERAILDDAGLAQVIALRARYGASATPLGAPADYRDLRWYERAVAALPR